VNITELLELNAAIHIDMAELDAAIEKANRLLVLLEKAKEMAGSQNGEEAELIGILGEDRLRSIGECVAEIVRQNGLHKSPYICKKLFHYLSNVIVGWNPV